MTIKYNLLCGMPDEVYVAATGCPAVGYFRGAVSHNDMSYVQNTSYTSWDTIRYGELRDVLVEERKPIKVTASWYEIEEKESKMRRLFDVFVVDPEEDTIVWSNGSVPIIATDKENASLKAVAKAGLLKDIDDYDIVLVCLGGNIREKKTVQEVKVIK